ncbi:MAG: HrpE/YscL family type III secretion apparatus protein [Chlamydiota bacterium]
MTLFSLFSQSTLAVKPGKKIIPEAEFSQILEASEVLKKAKQDALDYHKKTEAECEELRKKAHEEGLQKGLEEFNEHILSLDKEAKKILLEMQKIILPLALKAAQKIVSREIELNPETIVDIVMQAMAPAKQNKKITIFANKSDLEALERNKPKLKEIFENLQVLNIQERPDVTSGGCMIETETGIINATAENQWKALENAFAKYK